MAQDQPTQIQGDLRALALAELLQLLDQGDKTGLLALQCSAGAKQLFLARGAIVCVASSEPRERLGRYLLRSGLIDATTLRRGKAYARMHKLGLGRSLVTLAAVSEE